MSIKKSPRADLESKRSLFFLFGLNAVLLVLIFVFQWKTETPDVKIPKPENPYTTVEVQVPRTIQQPAMQKVKYKSTVDKINPKDDVPVELPKLNTTNTISFADTILEPIEDFTKDEEPELVPWVMVQKLAVPIPCSNINERDEQSKCLNKWIRNYINENIDMHKIRQPMLERVSAKVHFVISEHGKVEDVTIVQGKYEPLNLEIKRLLGNMPNFQPASQMGKKVRMSMAIPVNVNFR